MDDNRRKFEVINMPLSLLRDTNIINSTFTSI